MELTHKDRFNRLFKGEPVDRVPFLDYMGKCNYNSCLARWKTEGLNVDATWDDIQHIIGFDYSRGIFVNAKMLVYPEYEPVAIGREGNRFFMRNKWGGLETQLDGSELMPVTVEGAVHDRKSWELCKERLQGNIAARIPENIKELSEKASADKLPVFAGDLPAGFFGALRELMGFEVMSYMFYDDPSLMHEILDVLCELWINIYSEIQKHIVLDYVFIWEDMCCKTGPLISPAMFNEFLSPRYKRLTSAVRSEGCRNVIVDSDGDGLPLVPLWLDGGVNIVFPWESIHGQDILKIRKQYPEMGIIGALNKHALEYSHSEIDKELEKIPAMLENGYYIPCCDHGVTNMVSWDNYRYFYEKLKDLIWKYPPQGGRIKY